MILSETNPLEDLKGLLLRPFRFSRELSFLRITSFDQFILIKSFVGALFFFSLYALSVLPSSLEEWLSQLFMLFERFSPQLKWYGFTVSEIFETKVFLSLGMQLGFFVGFLFRLFAGAFGVVLISGVICLWKDLDFKETFVTVSYAHWFFVLGLLLHGTFGFLIVQLIMFAFVARVLMNKESKSGFKSFFGNFLFVASVFGVVGLLSLSFS